MKTATSEVKREDIRSKRTISCSIFGRQGEVREDYRIIVGAATEFTN
jgi:hypothetical protein